MLYDSPTCFIRWGVARDIYVFNFEEQTYNKAMFYYPHQPTHWLQLFGTTGILYFPRQPLVAFTSLLLSLSLSTFIRKNRKKNILAHLLLVAYCYWASFKMIVCWCCVAKSDFISFWIFFTHFISLFEKKIKTIYHVSYTSEYTLLWGGLSQTIYCFINFSQM